MSAFASLDCQEPSAVPGVLPARGLTVNGPVRLPKVHAALGFGLALLVLVALGTVTQASIADLVAANASATRSVEALERLQALKGSVREFEASELATRVPGQPLERDSPHAAYLDMIRLRRELNELLDSGPQRQRLQQLAAVIDGATAPFRQLFGATPADRTAAAVETPPAGAIGRGLRTAVEAIAVIEREEREVLGDRQALSASRARTAQVHVLLASVLGFITILIAGLMVRRDVLERRKATDRLERANATLAEAVAEAQRRGDEITRLSRLSHFLQGCRSPEEGCVVIEETAPALFGAPGALYLVSAERLDRAAAWGGGGTLQQSFPREDCWGMRQASVHAADPGSATPACPHLNGAVDAMCVPLVADGNSFGLLVVAARPDRPDGVARTTTLAAVEQISAGLANLRLRESLKVQSLRDPLTGLYNRRFLHDALSRECHDARRHSDRPVALLLLDVDFFKRVNDTSGHAAGDLLLQALAELLGRTFRGGDIACRFGGEEFAMVLTETPIDVALRRAEALRLAIHGLHAHHGNSTLEGLTASIGVTAGSGDGLTPERLLHEADTALYEAKARGRDCCVAFSGAPGARPLPFDSPPYVY